jgi:hypothetical protein
VKTVQTIMLTRCSKLTPFTRLWRSWWLTNVLEFLNHKPVVPKVCAVLFVQRRRAVKKYCRVRLMIRKPINCKRSAIRSCVYRYYCYSAGIFVRIENILYRMNTIKSVLRKRCILETLSENDKSIIEVFNYKFGSHETLANLVENWCCFAKPCAFECNRDTYISGRDRTSPRLSCFETLW